MRKYQGCLIEDPLMLSCIVVGWCDRWFGIGLVLFVLEGGCFSWAVLALFGLLRALTFKLANRDQIWRDLLRLHSFRPRSKVWTAHVLPLLFLGEDAEMPSPPKQGWVGLIGNVLRF